MNRFVPGIVKRHLKPARYLRLIDRTTQSLRTHGLRRTGHLIAYKVQRKLGLKSYDPLAVHYLIQQPTLQATRQQRAWSSEPGYRPVMHLVLPLSSHSEKSIAQSVKSVRAQSYSHWTLDVLCGPQARPKIKRLLQRWQKSDKRIRVLYTQADRSPCESLNAALAGSGECYFGLIQEGDKLSSDVLYHAAQSLTKDPELDVLYTDEAHIKPDGTYPDAVLFKPDWSPEMLLGYNYWGSLCLVRESIVKEIGGFDPRHQEAQEWDLALRLMERGCQTRRVPHCGYFRRSNNGYVPHGTATPATAASYRRVLKAYLDRQGLSADVETMKNGVQRIRWKLSQPPRVSIIIPSRNCPEMIRALVWDLVTKTDYPDKEIIVVDNDSTDPDVKSFYEEQIDGGHIRVVPFNREFNYSAACNAGYQAATGDLLLFMNNDMEVKSRDWLQELVGWALLPATGVVGTKLLYPNGHLQHGGVVVGLHFVTHLSHKAKDTRWGLLGTLDSYRNFLSVTGACQMVTREVFEAVGGFDENYRLVGSDIALCLRAGQMGYRTVYTPFAEFIHYEEYSRRRSTPFEDMERLACEIRTLNLQEDPYLHPQLHAQEFHPALRFVGQPGPREMLSRQLDYYDPPEARFQTIDWYDDEAVRQEVRNRGLNLDLPTYSPLKVADDPSQATRFVLHVLRKHKNLRERFPFALSDGAEGAFCAWLCNEGLERFRIPENAANTIRQVFAKRPGLRIRQLYGFRPDLRHTFPTAFLPTGQKPFLFWLLEHGRRDHQFRDEEIWWCFLEASEDPAREFEFTYNVQQDWQRNFPAASTVFGRERILNWLQRRHRLDEKLLNDIRSRTHPISLEEIRCAYWSFPHWRSKFPEAFRNDLDTQKLVAWLRSEMPGLPIPSVAPLSSPRLGMNVLAHFCYPSGLQQSARSIVRSLEMENIAVSLRDVPAHYTMDDPNRAGYLNLETHDVSLIHIQPIPYEEHPYLDAVYGSTGLEPRADVYRIGYWYWELEDIPFTWEKAAESVQELWAPTEFIAKAMKQELCKTVTPMLPGVKVDASEPVDRKSFGIGPEDYFFLFMFDMKSIMERKNPLGLIEAYRKAFRPDDKAKLLIKVSSGHFNPEEFARLKQAANDAGVILLDEILTREKSYGLIQACDCYVSLHRSEGFGLTLAEAMLMGKPVIGTNYSGNRDFMDDSCAMLVDYQLRQLAGTCPDYVYQIYPESASWAHPSVDHAANWMRWAYKNRDDARALGDLAQKHASQVLSPEAAGKRLKARLEQIYQVIGTSETLDAMVSAA